MVGLRTIGACVSAILLVSGLAPALAQQQIPGSVAPGRIEQPLQPPQGAPPATSAPVVPRGLAPTQAPPGAEKVHFTLQKLVIEDAVVFTVSDFAPLYEKLIGKDVTLQQVYEVAAAITAKYGEAGYILSQALVPAQQITNGVVRLTIVEGFIDKVIFKNETGAPVDNGLLQEYGAKISASRPLQASDLERYLLLMNDLPGVGARSFMQPSSATPGAADLIVVIERKQVDGSVSVDNRGTKFIGPYQATLSGAVNNVLGLNNRTELRTTLTSPLRDLHYVDLSHEEEIDSEGTVATLGGFFSDAHPGFTQTGLEDQDVSGWAQLVHPLIRSRTENVSVRGRVEINELDATQNNLLLSHDNLRIARLQLAYSGIDTLWNPANDLAAIELSQGVPVFGASAERSRPGTRASFTKVAGSASRTQPLFSNLGVLVGTTWQASGEVLPGSEEFGFGGADFGRGYDPSEIIGDSGVAGKVELQWTESLGQVWLSNVQPYAFFDAGAVWSNFQVPGVNSEATATSTGAGVRADFGHGLSAYAELGVPLTRTVFAQGNRDPRFFFGVTGRF
ncbi:MAG TPA: ShlB/FhaC/HecB family hemolysin secretion/activation protein [Stellaceae bacterium]|nr:ShlB/FhaC/HecB family hemolysin secretion/activation protein [Stellaceae bacterium]